MSFASFMVKFNLPLAGSSLSDGEKTLIKCTLPADFPLYYISNHSSIPLLAQSDDNLIETSPTLSF